MQLNNTTNEYGKHGVLHVKYLLILSLLLSCGCVDKPRQNENHKPVGTIMQLVLTKEQVMIVGHNKGRGTVYTRCSDGDMQEFFSYELEPLATQQTYK